MIGQSYVSGWKVLGLLACLSLAGCGASKGTVEGTVTYKGKPLPVGTVSFFVGNQVVNGTINPDGTYRAVKVPAGNAKVSVQTPEASSGGGRGADAGMSRAMAKMQSPMPSDAGPSGPGQPGGSAVKSVPIPKQYANPDTSGLSTTVKGGKNAFDIDLK